MDVNIVRYPGDMYEVLKWAVNRQLKEIPPEFDQWLLGLMPEKCRELQELWQEYEDEYRTRPE